MARRRRAAKKPAPLKKPGRRQDRARREEARRWDIERHRRLGSRAVTSSAPPSPTAGNSVDNETGGWRTNVPTIDPEKCTGCMLCYFYCPDASILIENDKATGIDLAHCKGCGICAKECPADAITMSVEEKE